MSESVNDRPRTYAVVMPVYNREAYLETALRSALEQELPPQQILVVDDGSTDRSVEIARGFEPRVRVLTQANAGCAAARNAGIAEANADYIAFLDSDDAWFPWTLRLADEAIGQLENEGKPVSIVELVRHDFRDTPPAAESFEPLPKLRTNYHADLIGQRRVVATSVMVASRAAVEAAGGFVPIQMNGTDAEFNLRVGAEPGYVRLHGPPMVAYRDHDANVMKNLSGTHKGIRYMLEQEQAGVYPGGAARAADRRAFITQQVRSMSVQAVRGEQARLGWDLYRRAFAWNLAEGRWKYLLGLPAIAVKHQLLG